MKYCLLRISGKYAQTPDEELVHMLRAAGMEVDETYGVVPLGTDRKEVLVRGVLTGESLEAVRKAMDVEVFSDLPIMPFE